MQEASTLGSQMQKVEDESDDNLTLAQLSKDKRNETVEYEHKLFNIKERSKHLSPRTKKAVSGQARNSFASFINVAVDGTSSRGKARSSAVIRAEEVQLNLEPGFPSFVKSLVRSHVTGCFWMGLPGLFCKNHLPDKDTTITVEDESGKEYELKYISYKTGLSAGWRHFSVVHKLQEGDALIFQLVKPTKFKNSVRKEFLISDPKYMVRHFISIHESLIIDLVTIRATGSRFNARTVKVALVSKRELYAVCAFECCVSMAMIKLVMPLVDNAQTRNAVASHSSKRKHDKSVPVVIPEKKKTRVSRLVPKVRQPAEQSENDSEKVRSEVLEGFFKPMLEFKDIKSFEHFSIIISGKPIDAEISKEVRNKYYKLCHSQQAFLHDNLIEGMNYKLIAGIISETVDIAEAIKRNTSSSEFAKWDKILRAFEHLGMEVEFLRRRIRRLVSISYETGAPGTKKYLERRTESSRANDEIKNVETKLEELKAACNDFGDYLESLKYK
ncbi:B3 domain-containing protein [Senna tora]|uniref:B3 domain-containing protein n=1 Tax=Senna tora TaxID=362788 RepID=A0A834SXN7_9FABA|nr:B3 domain-containing protein [Senna tora]